MRWPSSVQTRHQNHPAAASRGRQLCQSGALFCDVDVHQSPFLVKVGDWQPRMENFQEYLQIDQCYLNLRKARHIPTHGQMANWIMEVKPGRIDLGEVAASGQRSSLRAAWPIDGRLCLHSIVLLVTNLLILLHFSLPRWLALANWRIDVMNRHEMIGQALFLGIEKGTLLHWWLYHAKLIN